jgi:hypothetical protein
VLNVELSWQEAAVAAACLLGAGNAVRWWRRAAASRAAALTREAGVMTGLFAFWQFAGSLSAPAAGPALARAAWIWHAERRAGLPAETGLQRAFLPHPLLVQVCNLYYAALHFLVLIACLLWVFLRHRGAYPRVRAMVVLLTAACLVVQLAPVAPPRLLPGDGMVDTAARYGQSVYSTTAGLHPDQLSAMPSIHVGWALLVAVVVVQVSRRRWRWLALLYPALTTLVVVVTANHFWLDGIVAALLLAAVLLVQSAARAAFPALRAVAGGGRAVAQPVELPRFRADGMTAGPGSAEGEGAAGLSRGGS